MKISLSGSLRKSRSQYVATYNARAPAIPATISTHNRSHTMSGLRPVFPNRRAAVHAPTQKPLATKIPYQVTVKEPSWKAMRSTRG